MSSGRSKRRKKDNAVQELHADASLNRLDQQPPSQDMTVSREIIELLCYCPISKQLMADPVHAPDLNTYEKEEIETALQTGLPRLPNGMVRWPLGHEVHSRLNSVKPPPGLYPRLSLPYSEKSSLTKKSMSGREKDEL